MLKSKHVANTMLIEWFAVSIIVVFLLFIFIPTVHPTSKPTTVVTTIVAAAAVATFVAAAQIGASLVLALRIAAGF